MTVPGQDINTNVVLTSDVSGYSAAMRQASAETAETQTAVDRLVRSIDNIKARTQTGLKIFAAADTVALVAATKAAADFDTQMSALRANADLAGTSFEQTARSVTSLRRELPMTTREVTSMVEMMQKMSVADADIKSSVETFKRLSASTNEDMYSLADGVINFNRQMALPPKAIDATSDSLAVLSARMGVSATRVMGFAENIAPVARTVGMTSKEVLGFSSAFVKSGQDGFLAANVMTNMMMNIARATRYGSSDLAMYANAANMTVEGFKELSSSDQFLKIVQEINRAGPDAIRMLDRMGIDGARSARAIQALSQTGDLGKAMGLAGMDHSGAVLSASEKSMQGLNESVTRLTGSLQMLAETFGGPLAQGASRIVDLLTAMTQVADKAITPIGAIAGPLASIAGGAAAVLGSGAPVIGPLMTAAMGMSLFRGPGRAGFQYARAGGDVSQMSPYLRRGAESTLAGRGGSLQNLMWGMGMAAGGGGFGGFRGGGDLAGRAGLAQSFGLGSVGINLESPTVKKWMEDNKDLTKKMGRANENSREARAAARAAGVRPGGAFARVAFGTMGVAAGVSNFFRSGLEGGHLGRDDFTDRAMANRPGYPRMEPIRSMFTGYAPDGSPVTARGGAFGLGRAAGGFAVDGARVAGHAIGDAGRGVVPVLGRGAAAAGGSALGFLGMNPMLLGAMGLIGAGTWMYNQHKEGQQILGDQGRGQLDTALNKYAEALGIAGEEALSFANQITESRNNIGDPRRPTQSDRDRVIAASGEAIVDFSEMSEGEGIARLRTTFAVPGVDPAAQYAARDDLLRTYTPEQAQRMIEAAGEMDPVADIAQARDISRMRFSWSANSEKIQEQFKPLLDSASQQISHIALAYGTRSSEYGDAVAAVGGELLQQYLDAAAKEAQGIATRGVSSQNLAKALADLTGMNVEDENFIEAIRSGVVVEQVGGTTLTRALDLDNDQVIEILAKATEKGNEGLSQLLTRSDPTSGALSISERQTLQQQQLRTGQLSYLWTGPQSQLLEDVTFGDKIHTQSARREAGEQILEQMLARPSGLSGVPISSVMGDLIANMGYEEDDPVYQTYSEAIRTGGRQRGWQMGTSDEMAQMSMVAQNYRVAQEAYRANPDSPIALQNLEASEDEFNSGRSGLFNTLLSWKRGLEDLAFQRQQSGRIRERDLAWQREDYELQRGYSFEDFGRSQARAREDFGISRARAMEDFARGRARAEEDFNLQRKWSTEDYYLSLERGEFDYQLSRKRAEYDFNLAREYAQYDFNKSRRRQEEDFNHQQELMARQTARNMTDIYSRMHVQRTWDAQNLLVNSQEQLEKMSQHRQGLDQLREMGLSSDAIKLMGLNDFSQVFQVTRLVDDLMNDPTLVEQFNRQIAERMKYGMASLTDIDNEAYAEQVRQYELSRKRSEEDFELSKKRQDDQFNLSMSRQEEDYLRALERGNEDFRKALDRNDLNYKKSMDRQTEDFNRAMKRQGDDFARAMSRQGEDFATSMRRNEDQWERSLKRNNKVWEDQLEMAQESLNHSFRKTTGTFGELSAIAMGTMTGTTKSQMQTLVREMKVQRKEVEDGAKDIAKALPKHLAPLFGGEANMKRALSGTYFEKMLDGIFGTKSGGRTGANPGSMVMGGPDNRKTTADLDSYDAVLKSKDLGPSTVGGGSASVSGSTIHPLAGQRFYISSNYGAQRRGYIHNGIDMAAAKNTPVKAFADGVVKSAAFDAQSGNVIAIDHGNGYQTRYHHLNNMNVKAGQVVKVGQKIGGVGTTGWNSTGDHLHFSVYVNGRTVDPVPFLRGTSKIPKGTVEGASKASGGDIIADLDKFLYALRMQESNNNYKAWNPISGAAGAYQYIRSTWNNYKGYSSAHLAPASVQDQRARQDVLARWKIYGNWEQVAAHHLYPIWAGRREMWNNRPPYPGNPTIAQYVAGVMRHMGRAGGISTSAWAGNFFEDVTPTKAQIFQAIVKAKEMKNMEEVLSQGTLGNFIPRGRFSMGLASVFADKYDPGYADKSLKATEWFAKGAIVSGHTNAIIGERGPEMVLPLNEVGADFLANVMSKMQIEIPWADSLPVGGHSVTNNYYQTIDKGTHLHGRVTVVANDTGQMYQGLEREARRERLMAR